MEGECGGETLVFGEESWFHWAFSNSRDWICFRSSSFSAVVAVMDSAWFSCMELMRNEGEERELVPVVVGVGGWRLVSIIVPNKMKLLSLRACIGFIGVEVRGKIFELKCDSLTKVFVKHVIKDLVFLRVEAIGVRFEDNSFTIFKSIVGKPVLS